MGGKGQRRREKNFLASHGGDTRLPPPPKPKELDALPSKLRKLMQLKKQASLQNTGDKKRKRDIGDDKQQNPKDGRSSVVFDLREEGSRKTSVGKADDKDAITNSSSNDTKKSKRKRTTVEDLRFQSFDQSAIHSRKKERKKDYFRSKKKKQKKEMTHDICNFPGREEIQFGEIVQAPPKLSFPKASMGASKERVRLQTVEAYRNLRGWTSRPGVQLPRLAKTSSS